MAVEKLVEPDASPVQDPMLESMIDVLGEPSYKLAVGTHKFIVTNLQTSNSLVNAKSFDIETSYY